MHVETIVVGDFASNCFLAWEDPESVIVIDPGAEADIILDEIAQKQLKVGLYLLTHAHIDHLSALADMRDAMPAPMAMHAGDIPWAFEPDNLLSPFYPAPRNAGKFERILEDKQKWNDSNLEYTVIWTPGHTPGCVCFHFEKEKVVFTGDTLFAGSVGRTDLAGGNPRELSASLKRLKLLPDETVVYAGHGPSSSIGKEKRTNYFMSSGGVL